MKQGIGLKFKQLLITLLHFTFYTNASTTPLETTTCLPSDIFTIFGRPDYNLESFQVATAPDLGRVLIGGRFSPASLQASSSQAETFLTYIDMDTCQSLFVIKDDQPFQPGFALIIDTEFTLVEEETLYQVGLIDTGSTTPPHRMLIRSIDLSKFPNIEAISFDATNPSYAT